MLLQYKRLGLVCRLLIALAIAAFGSNAFAQTSNGTGWTSYYLGSTADVTRTTTGGVMLMGGGTDVDDAFRWMIGKSGGGNFVVLRASGTDAYNSYIKGLGTVSSVETLIVTSRTGANDPYVAGQVSRAEAVFIAGGDQAQYWTNWKDTQLSSALQGLADKGVPIGGTSAGMAVLGQHVYTALNNTVYPDEALANPYDSRVTLGSGFLNIPNMQKIITEPHFYQRDRMGRMITFLARLVKDFTYATTYGIAVDEATAVLVEANGGATIVGSNYAYFFKTPGTPQVCTAGQKLTYSDVGVYRITGSATFNLKTWAGSGGVSYKVSATRGVLSANPPGGSVY